jgi:nucleotide-binding universal stress UspA family protein
MKTAISVLDGYPDAVASPAANMDRMVRGEIDKLPYADLKPPATLKILAPIDLSAEAAPAVEYAVDLAQVIGAQLTLLHVTDVGSDRTEWPPYTFDTVLPGGIERFVARGSVAGTIAAFAEYIDAGMVLMTSENRNRWTPFWKHSVTGAVLGSTTCPVLVAGLPKADSHFRCRRIMCVLSLDGSDDAILRQAEALTRRTRSELILVAAVPEPSVGLYSETGFGANRPLSTRLAAKRLREAGRNLSVLYKTWVSTGSLPRCVDRAAREYSPDLVIAARGKLNMEIVRRVQCPVLFVTTAQTTAGTFNDRVSDLQFAKDGTSRLQPFRPQPLERGGAVAADPSSSGSGDIQRGFSPRGNASRQ